jgi:hypothetical protein
MIQRTGLIRFLDDHLTPRFPNASMGEMRRAVILGVAVGYGLSFVAVCLAACLMGPMVADHACCAGDEGIRAADQDCCSVTPGLAHAGSGAAIVLPTTFVASPSVATVLQPLVGSVTAVEVASSPPLVLRV